MKPRNLMVPMMLKRKSGPHGKTKKALRRLGKMAINQEITLHYNK
jgi:hypothetical protein